MRHATILALLVAACASPCPTPCALEFGPTLTETAGAGATDCGDHAIAEDPATLFACLDQAQQLPAQAFRGIRRRQGDDSNVAEGFVGTSDGQRFRYLYDSDPSGGSQRCGAHIVRQPCTGFAFDSAAEITCEGAGVTEPVCG